ncbi:MAG: ABC transporter permease [Nocardioidaceae bacterium]
MADVTSSTVDGAGTRDQARGRLTLPGSSGYVLRRLFGAVLSLLAVAFIGFFLFRVIPGDPVRTMTEDQAVSTQQLIALRHEFGLDKPLWQQFVDYVVQLLHLDLGTSFQYRGAESVSGLILEKLGPTVLLVGTATVLSAALGLWLGIRSAWRNGSTSDRVNTGVALTLWSVPTFWLGLMMIIVLAAGVGPLPDMFPAGGMRDPYVTGWALVPNIAHHLVLPVVTLVAVVYAQYLLVMRSSLLDEIGSDYLVTARAKGLRDVVVRRRHALPNALLPAVTMIAIDLGQVVAGTILVETVFSWPGLGHMFYEALKVPDLPLVQGMFIFFSAAVILLNLLTDLTYPLLDPRVAR